MSEKPVLLVLHGPAGAGKDAVINGLRARTGIKRATSATTRPRRDGEREGVDYFFLSKDEFERGISAKEFCEWAVVYKDYKGVQRSEIEVPLGNGEDLIVRTDVQGARTWRTLLEGAIFVFIMADDPDTLRKRLEERLTETAQSLETRLGELDEELADIPNNDYVVRNRHGHLEEAIDDLQRILEKERSNPDRAVPRLLAEASAKSSDVRAGDSR